MGGGGGGRGGSSKYGAAERREGERERTPTVVAGRLVVHEQRTCCHGQDDGHTEFRLEGRHGVRLGVMMILVD